MPRRDWFDDATNMKLYNQTRKELQGEIRTLLWDAAQELAGPRVGLADHIFEELKSDIQL